MDALYEYMADIMSKRVPIESANVRVDQITSKIILIDIPEGVYHENYTETVKKPPAEEGGEEIVEKIERKQNTDEKAVILIKVP